MSNTPNPTTSTVDERIAADPRAKAALAIRLEKVERGQYSKSDSSHKRSAIEVAKLGALMDAGWDGSLKGGPARDAMAKAHAENVARYAVAQGAYADKWTGGRGKKSMTAHVRATATRLGLIS